MLYLILTRCSTPSPKGCVIGWLIMPEVNLLLDTASIHATHFYFTAAASEKMQSSSNKSSCVSPSASHVFTDP